MLSYVAIWTRHIEDTVRPSGSSPVISKLIHRKTSYRLKPLLLIIAELVRLQTGTEAIGPWMLLRVVPERGYDPTYGKCVIGCSRNPSNAFLESMAFLS